VVERCVRSAIDVVMSLIFAQVESVDELVAKLKEHGFTAVNS
jgi:hypothetical protein